MLADYFGRGVFNTVPNLDAALSAQVVRKELPVVSWGPQNAGPGSEAILRKNEGKTNVNSAGNLSKTNSEIIVDHFLTL